PLINVYAPTIYPKIDERGITILAGDFNTNLDPHGNRISRSPSSNDPTRKLFSDLTAEYIDIALATACAKPLITYHQNTRGGHMMATSTSASDKIQIPGHNQANSPTDKLQYMKNIYQDIYKAENNDLTIAEFFVKNQRLVGPISEEEV
ncbi:2767_t:CDS:2, partial [Gigaspora rosea]